MPGCRESPLKVDAARHEPQQPKLGGTDDAGSATIQHRTACRIVSARRRRRRPRYRPTRASAFEQAALALTLAVTDPTGISSQHTVEVACEAPDDAFLLLDWLNSLIYEMAVRRLVFGRFAVSIEGHRLHGRAWGEPVDRARHRRSSPRAQL